MKQDSLPWDSIDQNCQVFKALGHRARLAIVYALQENKELCVQDLQKIVGSSMPTTSRHLDVLKTAGIVTCEKRNNNIFYSLRFCCLKDLCQCIDNKRKEE